MEENSVINNNNNNDIEEQNTNQNMEVFDEINVFKDMDEEDEKNDAVIQDLIKQGKYLDVIKYLESQDNKGKNIKENKDNNDEKKNEEELVIIPADDISDLHEDNNISNISKSEKEDNKNKNDEIKEIIDDNKNNNENNDIDKNQDIQKDDLKEENKIDKKEPSSEEKPKINEANIIIEKNQEQNVSNIKNDNNNNDEKKEEENISPKELIKNIINTENNKNKKSQPSSHNSSKSISLLHLSMEEEQETNNYYEERLKEIQEERKIFSGQNNITINNNNKSENNNNINNNNNIIMNNLQLLAKELEELNELENNENADLNGIEQMNEMYSMLQEDKSSNYLQEKERERLFPFYNKGNINIKDEIKNEYFTSINLNHIRNFFISSKILDIKNINKRKNYNNNKYSIERPKSIFDELKFDKSDIKALDYDEILDDFFEEKKGEKNNVSKRIEKIFDNYRKKNKGKKEVNTIKKPKEIYLNKKKDNKENKEEKYEINFDDIYNKYKDSIDNLENENELKKFNEFYLDNFNKKNEIFNFNDYSIDLDLDDEIKKEIINTNKSGQNNLEDKDKENYYLKINNNKTFNENILLNYSFLRFINLENNNLSKFPNLMKCTNIYSLNLNNNKITKIEGISNLIYLEKLSLSNNLISSIDNCFSKNNRYLRFLFLGHNKITSIENISQDIPFIEELILCQNNINYLPEKVFLPYIKFFDLNENKIKAKTEDLFFICPSLEKLLLLGNNLNEIGTKYLIKFCPRLKEIDLSFNKYNNMIELVELLSINSNWNNNLEMINVVGNNFFNSSKNKEMFYLLIKKFCPSVKHINYDEIKKNNKINNNDIILNYNRNYYNNINCNLNESYINIFNAQHFFMKYFTSVYFTNKIFDTYNININNNIKTNNIELFSLINKTYYQFKLSHFISQLNINKGQIGFFSFDTNFQFSDLLIYLYKFKSKMIFIQNSIPIFVKRSLFRRMKIIKIQQHYKLRILRKKLAAIVIPDDEDDHAEDLLDFFNSENKEKEENKFDDEDLNIKIKEIGKKIEKNIEDKNLKKNKNKLGKHSLEVIKEEEKEKDLDIQLGINLDKIPDLDISDNDIKDINEIIKNDFNDNTIKNNNKNKEINTIKNNNKIINNINTKKEIISIKKENPNIKDTLIEKLLLDPKYSLISKPKLAPINPSKNSSTQLTSNIKPNNNIDPNIDILKKDLGFDNNKNIYYIEPSNKKPLNAQGHKIILKDEKHYGTYIDINAQSNLPKEKKEKQIKRPESKGVVLPKINPKLNVSTTTISNDTKSVFSQQSNGKKMKINHKAYKPIELIQLEKEMKEAIEKAKGEWNVNKELENLIVKKITKQYHLKKKKLLFKNVDG